MRGEDVAQVRTVEDVLEGGEDTDPYRRSPFARNKTGRSLVNSLLFFFNSRNEIRGEGESNSRAGVEEDKVRRQWQGGQHDLTGNGHDEGQEQDERNQRLAQRTGRLDDAQREDAHADEQEVLAIVDGPLVAL